MASPVDKPITKCMKCQLSVEGQFVRALGGCYHLDCFQCLDCSKVVATRFFPLDLNGQKYPLCERDYFRRLDLLCANCNEALRGSYVSAVGKKYHLEHFTCSMCPTVFGPNETYYEHGGKVFCHYHFSIEHASICGGCKFPILKQFVEVKSNQSEQWHPECYMIFKSWNIRLSSSSDTPVKNLTPADLKLHQQVMEEKSTRIWNVLSAFEESAAACISDMLLHVSNQAYVEAVSEAGNFILHVEVLFSGIDNLDQETAKSGDSLGLNFNREPKMLAKKIVNFFSLLSHTQDTIVSTSNSSLDGGKSKQQPPIGTITQELLSLVTGLAQYLKILIRIALAAALRLERVHNHQTIVGDFLNKLVDLGEKQVMDDSSIDIMFEQRYKISDINVRADLCVSCKRSVEEPCFAFSNRRWHKRCLVCSVTGKDLAPNYQNACVDISEFILFSPECAPSGRCRSGLVEITQLEQYTFLLRVALKRLYGLLRNKDESNVNNMNTAYSLLRISIDGNLDRTSPSVTQISMDPEYQKEPIKDINDVRIRSKLGNAAIGDDNMSQIKNSLLQTASPKKHGADSVHNIVESTAQDNSRSDSSLQGLQSPNSAVSSNWPMSPTSESTSIIVSDKSAKGKVIYMSEVGALERLIVHQLTILCLHPLVKENFSLNELIDLFKNRKASFWSKMLASFKTGRKVAKIKESGTFGVALDSLVEKYGTESHNGNGMGRLRIPIFIDSAISALRRSDLKTEGIFRKNGNIKHLNELQSLLDNDPGKVNLNGESAIQIAALIKKFLRDLPEPLLTFKLYRLFILSQTYPELETRKRILHYCCCLLPKSNRDVLEVLLAFLRDVAKFSGGSDGNKMDISNLATVIAPNILYSKSISNASTSKDDSFLVIDVVKMLLAYQDEFWLVPSDVSDIMASIDFNSLQDVPTKDALKKCETAVNLKRKSATENTMQIQNSNSQTDGIRGELSTSVN